MIRRMALFTALVLADGGPLPAAPPSRPEAAPLQPDIGAGGGLPIRRETRAPPRCGG